MSGDKFDGLGEGITVCHVILNCCARLWTRTARPKHFTGKLICLISCWPRTSHQTLKAVGERREGHNRGAREMIVLLQCGQDIPPTCHAGLSALPGTREEQRATFCGSSIFSSHWDWDEHANILLYHCHHCWNKPNFLTSFSNFYPSELRQAFSPFPKLEKNLEIQVLLIFDNLQVR